MKQNAKDGNRANELFAAITRLNTIYMLNSFTGYKYRPWEKRKLREKIDSFMADYHEERCQRSLDMINNINRRCHHFGLCHYSVDFEEEGYEQKS